MFHILCKPIEIQIDFYIDKEMFKIAYNITVSDFENVFFCFDRMFRKKMLFKLIGFILGASTSHNCADDNNGGRFKKCPFLLTFHFTSQFKPNQYVISHQN